MVGEIRDPETAQIAIQSALTGHLVFTTVHANNVLDVLGRFLNMGVEPYQFVSALNCVLAQRLVRNICVHCKRPAKVTPRACSRSRQWIRRSSTAASSSKAPAASSAAAPVSRAGPRSASSWICRINIREMILDRRPTSEIKKAARDEGMRFLRESAVERVLNGNDDVARDQQGHVRRMSADTVVSTRKGPGGGLAGERAAVGGDRDRGDTVTVLALSRVG